MSFFGFIIFISLFLLLLYILFNFSLLLDAFLLTFDLAYIINEYFLRLWLLKYVIFLSFF
jgi:hypothetical protein